MMENTHITQLVSDYVLELLPLTQRQSVEAHSAHCAVCRQALWQERQLAQAVRATLATTGQASPARLRRLMPAPPKRPVHWLAVSFSPARLAVIGLLLILVVGTISYGYGHNGSLPAASPTSIAATATNTAMPLDAPTATVPAGHYDGPPPAAALDQPAIDMALMPVALATPAAVIMYSQ